MANNITDNSSATPMFQAGNRKLNRTNLENTLVSGIEPYIQTYQDVWGKENTAAVRQAYSQLINAIHDGKVSMNIDGSLHISDGSIQNTPDRKGFDPVAKAAYFVTSIVNRMPEYKEPKKETKKYGTDTFVRNFASYLTPPDSSADIGELWVNLDDEVEDSEGKRTRPYTNRLAYFNKFLDNEIANLDNYDEFDEYWGDKDAFKARLLDLKTRLGDNDISKEDSMLLAKLGFNPQYFDTTGTPLTDEEIALREKNKAEAEAKLKEEQAKKAAEVQANRGVLGKEFAVYGRDAANNTAAYEQYLADTYGTGEAGFNAVNNKIQALLEKASDDNSNLSDAEKRQLGNFISYIRQNNPAYQNQQLDAAEIAELQSHPNYVPGNVIRLPWTTKNGRYVYANDNGDLYFLKPNNQVKFDYKYGTTGSDYKRNFLTNTGINPNGSVKAFSKRDWDVTTARAAAFIGDVISLGGGYAGWGGSIASALADLYANIKSDAGLGRILTDMGWDVGTGVLSTLPFGKSVKFTRYGKYLPEVFAGLGALGITFNEQGRNAITKLVQEGPDSLTREDWDALTLLGRQSVGVFAGGRASVAKRKYGNLTQDVHQVTTAKGEKVNLTAKQRAEVEKIGNSKGQKAANEKFKEHAEANGTKIKEGDGLKEGTFKETPTKLDQAKARRIPYTQMRPGGNRLEAERQTIINPEQKERFEALSRIREQNRGRWNPREFGFGVGKDNPGMFFDIYTNGIKAPKTANPTQTLNKAESAEVKLLSNSPVPNRIQKINEFVQTDNPEKIRAARQIFENTKAQMHPDQVNVIGKKIADAEVRIQRQANAEHNMRQAQENNKKSENLLKSGGIDANISRARAYISGQPKLTALLDKLMGKTTWKQMSVSPEFKKLTRNQKLVLERAYNMLFEKEGGKLYKHQLGGKVQMFQGGGGVSHNKDTKWKNLVFDTYLQELLDNLRLGGHKYAKWVNSMQTRHSGLYNQANKQDFLTTPWRHETVGSYQTDYRENPLAPLPWETEDGRRIGYNTGIRNAARNNRYNVASPKPTSGDADAQNYISDSLYSGETDDRRILGREGDFTPEELNALNEQLKTNGNFFAYLDKDKYYKLGFIDDSGNKRVFTDTGDAAYVPININEPGKPVDIAGSINNPTVPDGKIDVLAAIRGNRDVYGEGTELNKNKADITPLLQKGAIYGLSLADMLGAIATTNKNFKVFRDAERKFRPLDYSQHYHQVMDDYAGNQFVNNQAADIERETGRPKTSNAALNAAVALEGILKAGNLRQQQVVRDQDIRQKHAELAEQYGNANRDARVDTANKNSAAFYDIERRIADAEQDRNLGNWTSISNFIKEGIYDAKNAYNERKQIRDAWAANQLGTRSDYIKQAINMDNELYQLREEFKKDPNNVELANKIRNLTSQRIYTYGTQWDQLYAQQYGVHYGGPRYTPWDMFQRYGIQYARGGKLTSEEEYLREDNRTRRANADRFMRTIWKAIDLYLQQKTRN